MKKTMVAGIALASTILSFNAFAGTAGDTNSGSDNHVYAEVAGGYSKLHNINVQSIDVESINILFNQSHVDSGGFAFSARLGMNFATDNSWAWGYELGYFNLAKAEAKGHYGGGAPGKIKFKQQGVDFLGTINKQLNDKIGLFAKAGIAVVKQDCNGDVSNFQIALFNGDSSDVLPEIAGGVSVNLTDSLALTGTVNHLFGKSVNTNITPDDIASSTSAMVGVRFNIS